MDHELPTDDLLIDHSDPRVAVLEQIACPLILLRDHIVVWANEATRKALGGLLQRDLRCLAVSELISGSAHAWRVEHPDGPALCVEGKGSFDLGAGRSAILADGAAAGALPGTVLAASALEHTTAIIAVYDASWHCLHLNRAAEAALLHPRDPFPRNLALPEDFARLERLIHKKGEVDTEMELLARDGPRVHVISIRTGFDPRDDSPVRYVSAIDISAQRAAEKETREIAFRCQLTGLANRTAFVREVASRIESLPDEAFALLIVDLAHFRLVNESLGYELGDRLLRLVSRRLESLLGNEHLIARLGSDEFAIAVWHDLTDAELDAVGAHILHGMSPPFVLEEHRHHARPTIGAARYPLQGTTTPELMRHADLAGIEAKQRQCGFVRFDEAMNRRNQELLALHDDLVKGMRSGEFEVWYQPRVDIRSGRTIGFEALVRWRHPVRGILGPGAFLDVAEQRGIIIELGNRVMLEAMTQQRAWHRAGHDVGVSINISAKQFAAQNLANKVADAIRDVGCDPTHIELEITESVLVDAELVVETLEAIKGLGVRIAIDDFGTGYSNLGYLRRFPVDVLKVDRMFVADPELADLCQVIIDIGGALELRVVAEGVETEERADWLAQRAVHEAQGYLYAPPMTADEATEYLRRERDSGPLTSSHRVRQLAA